jgi:hypothetical protein
VDRRFYDCLSRSVLWRTLVAEQIAIEASWSDPRQIKTLADLFDQIKAFAEKIFDKKKHPATRIAAAALSTLTGLWTVHAVAPGAYDALTLPVRAALTGNNLSLPVTFIPQTNQTTGLPVSIPLQVVGSGGEIGIRVKSTSNADPIQVHVAADQGGGATLVNALSNVAVQMQTTNNSSVKVVSQLNTLEGKSASLDGSKLIGTLGTINTSVGGLKKAYEENARAELNAANERVNNLDAGFSSGCPCKRNHSAKNCHHYSPECDSICCAAIS